MTINNKLQFHFLFLNKISNSLSLRLRERTLSRPIISTERCHVLLTRGLPITSIVAIKVDPAIFITADCGVLRVHILALVQDLFLGFPSLFYKICSVYIYYWDYMEFNSCEDSFVFVVLLDIALVKHFKDYE
jgi:hypothetical protein